MLIETPRKMTALSLITNIRYFKRCLIWGGKLSLFIFICSLMIDQSIRIYVREQIFTDIETIPYRPYALVLGTSKYVTKGKINDYYITRLEAAKQLLEQKKADYLLLSGDNRTLQYNEPHTMFRDLHKMGVDETRMYRDFAGFRTLDSIVRANSVFKIPTYTIVSQRFHCERAVFIAKFYNIDAICFVAKSPETYFSLRIREIFARVKAIMDLMTGVKPHFLGLPEPLPMPNEQ